jgi:hypothetical protein
VSGHSARTGLQWGYSPLRHWSQNCEAQGTEEEVGRKEIRIQMRKRKRQGEGDQKEGGGGRKLRDEKKENIKKNEEERVEENVKKRNMEMK